MRSSSVCRSAGLGLALLLGLAGYARAQHEIVFEDVTDRVGIGEHVAGWRLGHGAAWGDVTGNGRPDLYIGAFADRPMFRQPGAPAPAMLFINTPGGFVMSEHPVGRFEGTRARVSGAAFADVNGNGHLDLIVAMHAREGGPYTTIMENLGDGTFRDAAPTGDWPYPVGGRNVGAMDFTGDGRLEVFISDGSYSHYRSGGGRLIVLQRTEGWDFREITEQLGLPMDGAVVMGLAIGDVNNDGVMDLYYTDSNRMFVSGPSGYREVDSQTFAVRDGVNTVAAAFGDLTGNGLLDLVVTEHVTGAYVHVYINRGIDAEGMPRFENVSALIGLGETLPGAGMTGVNVKSGHVAIRDLDNDGRMDIIKSLIYKAEDGSIQPFVLQNLGTDERGLPRLRIPPVDRLLGYYAPGPVADYDGDGRSDIFLPSWFDEHPNYLFRNVTRGGNWLTVQVRGQSDGLNAMGIGAIVRVYRSGHAGEAQHLVGRFDIAVGTGYSSGEEALAHLGLGELEDCDVEVTFGGRVLVVRGVAANQAIQVDF